MRALMVSLRLLCVALLCGGMMFPSFGQVGFRVMTYNVENLFDWPPRQPERRYGVPAG